MYGISRNNGGYGVIGESAGADSARGVYGRATSASGTNTYGVYAENPSSSGYALYSTGPKNYFDGKVGIGATAPVSTLEVNGDIKLAARSAPPAAAGKIYFDSSTNRLNYHDGTQWIEVDPAYTTNEVKESAIINLVTNNSYYTLFTTPSNKDVILTNVQMETYLGGDSNTTFEVTLKIGGSGGTQKAFFSSHHNYNALNQALAYKPFDKTFPIPIKVPKNTEIGIYVHSVFGAMGASMKISEFRLSYIELPL